LIVFPNCKINLGLNILGKRADGYHNLETIFFPLPFYDVLEVVLAANAAAPYTLAVTGMELEGNIENNLCVKAYKLLKQDFPHLPAVHIHLHKSIPAGAGLGGGSADGAFMLMLLNDKFKLHLTEHTLLKYAFALGSDCPFFIINQPCLGQQRGEMLHPLVLDLSAYKIVIINPGIHVNTGWAFTQVTFSESRNLQTAVTQPVEEWKQRLTNDFELPVFEKYPAIKKLKEQLYQQNALYASMSGSGSTVFGIFRKDVLINYHDLPPGSFVKEMDL